MAALDFPSSPTDGQVYQNWIYNTAKGAWKAKPLTPAKTVNSDTPPSSPQAGDQWFNTVDSTLYIYYTDVDGSQWVESRAPIISDGYYSPNYIINGGMDVWQRGTSGFTASNSYTADRWRVDSGTVARATGTAGIQYALGITGSSGNPVLRQGIELPAAGLAGQFIAGSTWTVSFYAKTSTSVASNLAFYSAFVDIVSSGTNAVQVASATNIGASSTSWTRYSYTFTVAATPAGTNLALEITPYLNSGAYAGTFSVTGLQLESGSVATPFRRNANSLQGELAACQRYYEKSYDISVAPGTNTGVGVSWFAGVTGPDSTFAFTIRYAVPKRITSPVVTSYTAGGTSGSWDYQRSGASGSFSISYDNRGTESFVAYGIPAGATAFMPCRANGHWTADAEL